MQPKNTTIESDTKEEFERNRRYGVLILLARSDRPTHFKFHCQRCGIPIAEFAGLDYTAVTDVFTTDDKSLIGIRCNGSYYNGTGMRGCKTYHYFQIPGVESK